MSGEYSLDGAGGSVSIHLCFFLSIVLFLLGLQLYFSYQTAMEAFVDQMKFTTMLLPVLVLLTVHVVIGAREKYMMCTVAGKRSGDGAGSPWGVALVLIFLIFIVSCKNSVDEFCLLQFIRFIIYSFLLSTLLITNFP